MKAAPETRHPLTRVFTAPGTRTRTLLRATMLLLSLVSLLVTASPRPPSALTSVYPFLVTHESDASVEVTIQRVLDYIDEELPPVNVAVTVNHSAAAAGVGLELRATTVTVFGNPALGTLFMQSNQEHGLDLPLKLLAWGTFQALFPARVAFA
jgi:uncharacterized protein (DUF302 family)